MGAVGQTVMLLIMHTECIIHNRYTIRLIIIIMYRIVTTLQFLLRQSEEQIFNSPFCVTI